MNDHAAFQSRITTTVTDIPQSEWDSVFPPIAESYHFFKTLEETCQEQFKTFYITLYEGPRLACAAPCFVMDYPLDTTLDGGLKSALNWLEAKLRKKINLRILICGCTAAEGRIGIADVNRKDIAQALLSEMESLARKEKISLVAFKDFPDDYLPVFTPLLRQGLHRIPSYPAVALDIPYRSFEEYFATLSKATRKDLRRKFQKIENLPPVSFEVTNDIGSLLEEAYALYLNTLQKSDVQFERLTKEFFSVISKNMPQETRYFLWRVNGKLVAFDLCLVKGDTLVDEYIGMDYPLAYDYHLYYVTFRDIVNWCIQNNVTKYESGALNYDPKKRLDFRFVPHTIYMKHRNRIMNVFFGLLAEIIKPENFDPILKDIQKPKSHDKNHT
ncbi:MAG: GNAT family N-acetyltransferase [Candidatus Omnitrophica bacterium]|nr:GNAT family N-acetyltransferase [Candidatus Omnitrophota bacterium]